MRSVMAVAALVAGVACAPEPAAEAANAAQTTDATAVDTVAVLDAERAIWESIKRLDWPAFDSATAGMTVNTPTGFALMEPGSWAKIFGDSLVTKSYEWHDMRARVVSPDVVLLSFRATVDQTFNRQTMPRLTDHQALWRRIDGKWRAIAHTELSVEPPPK